VTLFSGVPFTAEVFFGCSLGRNFNQILEQAKRIKPVIVEINTAEKIVLIDAGTSALS
jgi:hypothetical protein